MRTSALAAIMLLLLAATARAEDTICDPNKRDCGCEKDWGCWELVYTTPGTILGVKTTLTQVAHGRGVEHGFVAAYATEHYGTRRSASAHFAAFGTIGGGSAGNEGSLGGAVDFGLRAPATETSGPFLRVGVDGLLLGHSQLYVAMLEPLQGRIGYQLLDGDTLLELGLTFGYVPIGRYNPAGGTRTLSDTSELGPYAALHLRLFRIDASFMHIPAEATVPYTPVSLVRIALCSYPRHLALCTDVLYVLGGADFGRDGVHESAALYAGFTLGLTP